MASGTGERPLGTIEHEKALMGLSGLTVTTGVGGMRLVNFGLNENTTYYLHFNDSGVKYGLFMLDGYDSTKRGMYMYGAGNNSPMHVSAVLATAQSGTSVTSSPAGYTGSRNYIKVVNGTKYAFCMIIAYSGVPPTVTTTAPT